MQVRSILDQEALVHNLYYLELHRERIAGYHRDMAHQYTRLAPSSPVPVRPVRAGLLHRRQPRLVARDTC
jgi:hypothetical protein